MSKLLAIDPGNMFTGYVILDDNFKPLQFGKVKNDEMLVILERYLGSGNTKVVVEMVASYMMNVGRTVFDTCIFIGRLQQLCETAYKEYGCDSEYMTIERRYVKLNLTGHVTASDADISRALVDRFSYDNLRNHGKGTKKEPGFFYGFSADMWAAFALGVTQLDIDQKTFEIIPKGDGKPKKKKRKNINDK